MLLVGDTVRHYFVYTISGPLIFSICRNRHFRFLFLLFCSFKCETGFKSLAIIHNGVGQTLVRYTLFSIMYVSAMEFDNFHILHVQGKIEYVMLAWHPQYG